MGKLTDWESVITTPVGNGDTHSEYSSMIEVNFVRGASVQKNVRTNSDE